MSVRPTISTFPTATLLWHESPPSCQTWILSSMGLQAGVASTTAQKLPFMGVTCSRVNPALRNRVAILALYAPYLR